MHVDRAVRIWRLRSAVRFEPRPGGGHSIPSPCVPPQLGSSQVLGSRCRSGEKHQLMCMPVQHLVVTKRRHAVQHAPCECLRGKQEQGASAVGDRLTESILNHSVTEGMHRSAMQMRGHDSTGCQLCSRSHDC